MSRDLAIDLGTANTLVYARGKGIVLNEPTVIALNQQNKEVLAMGHEAWQMIGRTPSYIVAARPLRGGAITDFEVTQRMIRLLFQRVGVSRMNRSRVLICVPSAITHVEQRAVLEAARRAGAAATYLIEQPMAAAIGAGLDIHEPVGNMVIDVGGGTSEVAVISLGGIVALEAKRVGSFDIDTAIQNHVRKEHGVAIGERIVILTPEEVRDAIEEQVREICDAVVSALSQTPPELAQDLIIRGIHLVGGGGLLKGLDQRISNETQLPVHIVNQPLESVVLGAGRCLEAFDSLKDMFMGKPSVYS